MLPGIRSSFPTKDQMSIVQVRATLLEQAKGARPTSTRMLDCAFTGCNTAVGNLDNSFLTATAEAGCCGSLAAKRPCPPSCHEVRDGSSSHDSAQGGDCSGRRRRPAAPALAARTPVWCMHIPISNRTCRWNGTSPSVRTGCPIILASSIWKTPDTERYAH